MVVIVAKTAMKKKNRATTIHRKINKTAMRCQTVTLDRPELASTGALYGFSSMEKPGRLSATMMAMPIETLSIAIAHHPGNSRPAAHIGDVMPMAQTAKYGIIFLAAGRCMAHAG